MPSTGRWWVRASLGAIFAATLEHRATEGAVRELQEGLGLGFNQIPIDLLEHRAVTPAPANVGQNQATIIPGVFPDSVAAFLAVDMPTVGVGEAVFPVLTKNAEVKTPAENAAAAETTGTFSADVLSPSRLQASFFYSREDRARFAGMDMALRENLSMALSDGLDDQILSGTNGLLAGAHLANHAAGGVTSFANYKSQLLYGRVDGVYAAGAGDIRLVVGAGTYAHAAGQYRATENNYSALDVLMQAAGGVRVSAHVPDVSGNKQNAVVRLGMRRDMVAPIWNGITLIPDEVTKAGTGQIVVTAIMLHAVKIPQGGRVSSSLRVSTPKELLGLAGDISPVLLLPASWRGSSYPQRRICTPVLREPNNQPPWRVGHEVGETIRRPGRSRRAHAHRRGAAVRDRSAGRHRARALRWRLRPVVRTSHPERAARPWAGTSAGTQKPLPSW